MGYVLFEVTEFIYYIIISYFVSLFLLSFLPEPLRYSMRAGSLWGHFIALFYVLMMEGTKLWEQIEWKVFWYMNLIKLGFSDLVLALFPQWCCISIQHIKFNWLESCHCFIRNEFLLVITLSIEPGIHQF